MTKLRYIFILLVGFMMVSNEAMAQRAGTPEIEENAILSRYQTGDWSMPRFAKETPLKAKLYATMGLGVMSSGNDRGEDIHNLSTMIYRVGGGYRFSPVHSMEFTANIAQQDMSYTLSYYMNLNNIVLNQDFRSRVEVYWGAAIDYSTHFEKGWGMATSVRMQYNMLNNVGLYVEPRLSIYKAASGSGHAFNNVPSINIGVSYKFGEPNGDVFNIFLPILIKSNLLYDLAMTPNIGFEVPISNRYSVAVELMRGWWLKSDNSFAWQMQAYDVEGRYWFGDRTKRDKLKGWFAGLFFSAGYYDIQLKELSGVQGEFYLLTGLGAGYAMPLTRRFGMEYELGLGYIVSDYQSYEVVENKYLVKSDYRRKFQSLMPVKVKVALTYSLFNKM